MIDSSVYVCVRGGERGSGNLNEEEEEGEVKLSGSLVRFF